ncbi:putative MFS transporter [Aspergillus fumigatus Af293]|uniref:MFS transporter, putative n=2 Tax=Aspergillus fumigatus TaxID=746128 RepID=Q4WYY3_ASPFU|nr:MFS transporter, putative [Aspergillus fumigatus Af293]EAL92120.1 MFS transporter, putative [Aspergillus fumigatus Af293]EDP52291.1 MFS transporter, putative [Aspergillus fumigatus A1163]
MAPADDPTITPKGRSASPTLLGGDVPAELPGSKQSLTSATWDIGKGLGDDRDRLQPGDEHSVRRIPAHAAPVQSAADAREAVVAAGWRNGDLGHNIRSSGGNDLVHRLGSGEILPGVCGGAFLPGGDHVDLSHRIAWFYAGSSLANAFGGLIGAGVLGNLDGAHGIAGWRWLFIIEGSITVGISLFSAISLPNYPATTSWLDETEQAYAQWRLINDAGEADDTNAVRIKDALVMVFRDRRIYLFILLQHCSLLSQTFQYFFPTIVKTLGYGSIETLLITAPVWVATFLVSLLVTWTSGRTNDRSWHIVGLMSVSAVGCIICTATTNIGARFFAMFLMPMGAVSAYQIIIAWVANSFPRPLVKRSAAIATANMIGNTATIYGSYMWPSSSGPRYVPGGSATAVVAVLVALLASVIRMVHVRMNKRLEEQERDHEVDNPGFRYIL